MTTRTVVKASLVKRQKQGRRVAKSAKRGSKAAVAGATFVALSAVAFVTGFWDGLTS
jgi:hypothetical protein